MEIVIDGIGEDITVKKYLYGVLKMSTASVKRVKYRKDGIKVNGENVTVRRVLTNGDVLSLAVEDTEEDENEYVTPAPLDIRIAFEDESVTVVDKPPFMPAHPSLGHRGDTVANALTFRYRSAPYVFRPINRLDRDTSGLMITARGKDAASRLCDAMEKGQIKKEYTAIVEGHLSEKTGVIKTFMSRKGESIVERCVCSENALGAKYAETRYRVVKELEGASVVRCVPVTGRTHQLRVHFAHIGHPMIGDPMYGRESRLISRHALHSSFTSFPHPITGETVTLFSPLPKDMKELERQLDQNRKS